MPTYTAIAVGCMAAAVAVDTVVLRTRLVIQPRFWISMAIMVFFQVFVDGWLTRSTETIVRYDDARTVGVRVFFNTPVEDFGFGFGLILLTLSLWRRFTAAPVRGEPR